MLNCLDLYSQLNTTYESFNNNLDDKAKEISIGYSVLSLFCFIIALIIAVKYFENVQGIKKYLFIALAAFFNIPFLIFYSIMVVHYNYRLGGQSIFIR
jgi:hypothetical protein